MNLGGTWIAFSRILGDEHEFTIKFAVDVQFALRLSETQTMDSVYKL